MKMHVVKFQALGIWASPVVNGLFVSAYASTSLSEYFARGFEEFFMGDVRYLKKPSPVLYSILESLKELED